MNNPKRITIKVPGNNDLVNMTIPEDLWKQIPEQRRQNIQDLSDYLLDSLRIGILATVNASITIDTKKMEEVVDVGITNMEQQKTELNRLFNEKLIGEKSDLSIQLENTLGEDGSLANLLTNLKSTLTNPELEGSIPAATKSELIQAANQVKSDLNTALDITDENTSLGKFVRGQQQIVTNINTLISNEFTKISSALGVDKILRENEQEMADLKDKSSHKGKHFENDAVESLQNIADILGDRIEGKGMEGEGSSRSKVGDIVIVIKHQGVPDLRIAVEAKSGEISRKEMIRQVRRGVENRNAARGIGLMDRRHMGQTQHIIGEEGENYIVGVDWDNGDFLSLEVTYRMLRSMMIADSLRMDGSESIDVNAIKKSLEQAKTDLGMLQSMKSQTSTAIGTLEGVRSNMDVMEKKVKAQLSEAEGFLTEE